MSDFIAVLAEARSGARQAPEDGSIRPDDVPGARWITWSTT